MRVNINARIGRAVAAAATAACLLLLTPLTGRAAAAMPVPASSACAAPARLTAGMTVASWRLGAVHFVTPGTGVAVTAPQIPCSTPDGVLVTQAQPVMLAVSTDAGRRWVTAGSALPPGGQATVTGVTGYALTGQVAALSTRNVWVLTSTGRLFATGNGGRTWTPQPLPGPVTALAQAGRELTALSCPPTGQGNCRPLLHRMRLPAGRWRAEPLPPLTATTPPQLSTASTRAAVLLVTPSLTGPAELVSTTDGGARWTTRPVPPGPPRPADAVPGGRTICAQPSTPLLATASARDWWLLCSAGIGMLKAYQVVLRTQDGGRTWQVIAQSLNLSEAAAPGALPIGSVLGFAAFSPSLLWITGNNYAAYSPNAGRTWTSAPDAVNPDSAPGLFDILSPADAWLLAPGTGLWHTTDGIHLTQAGQMSDF